ncbi:hypothetical protein [Pseudomonas sp. LB1P83]
MRTRIIAGLFTILTTASYAYADTCPDPSTFVKISNGYTATDESGRKWEGEYFLDEKPDFGFQSARYITQDEGEDGLIKEVSQMSCRYGNLSMDHYAAKWKPISGKWDKDNICIESIRTCSFSMGQ